jgi:hypothetical protein
MLDDLYFNYTFDNCIDVNIHHGAKGTNVV